MSGKISGEQEKTKSKSSQTTSLDPRLEAASADLLTGTEDLFQQGIGGIFQGQTLAPQDPLVAQGQQAQLDALGGISQLTDAQAQALSGLLQTGQLGSQLTAQAPAFQQALGISPTTDISATQQGLASQFGLGGIGDLTGDQATALRGLFGAGDISDPLTQRRISDLSDVVGEQFGRTILPQISQGAQSAGQIGGSRQGIAQGLAAGEAANAISRGATQALLGGQQVALNALGQAQGLTGQQLGGLLQTQGLAQQQAQADQQSRLAAQGLLQDLTLNERQQALAAQGFVPQVTSSLLQPGLVQEAIGAQRTGRGQQELISDIGAFEAPRQAELQRLNEFAALLGVNPLLAQTTTTGFTSGKRTAFGAEVGASVPGFGA